ncbi:integrin alpha-IIb [Oncorhynchus kisutch]|uniref:Integrin, alpha 2b n=1 Tax=Oncorhynchus kisutch TaxID=8019 RepID=A0A8C7FB35_ONCKI|nr:integrin alpha-IIb [Oncorhynchus kisutch]
MKKMEEHRIHRSIQMMGLLLFALPHYSDTLNLNLVNFTEFSGPEGSFFGFSADFYQFSNKTISVVVGAPRANTSQPRVTEAGAVYLCPWAQTGGACTTMTFDTKGDEVYPHQNLVISSSKSHQWFGATVRSSGNYIVACAPLFHWNVIDVGEREEAQNTPVGTCLVLNTLTGETVNFSPCRDVMTEKNYKALKYTTDRRYCEVGFSSDITKEGRLLIGAPGGYYFQGQIISAGLPDIVDSAKSQNAKPYVAGQTHSPETGGYDHYHGYSVATGEFTGDSIPDYVVGVPNDRNTAGSVKIYNGNTPDFLGVKRTFFGSQVASYFGHSVAVTDINNDGIDDILIGAPLFMERVSGQQLQEVGQVSVYLQRERSTFHSKPDQKLTGSQLYGRFGSTIAPLGDLDKDGFNDVAVGAPSSGVEGRVFVYMGTSDGLSPQYTQVIESPFRSLGSPAQFGFTLRGATDIDSNGYPDLIVGAWGVNKIAVYRAQAVVMAKTQLSLYPDFLNPDVKECQRPTTNEPVACFTVMMCISVSGHSIPEEIVLDAELQLDKMKQTMARRTLFLQTNLPQEYFQLTIQRDVGVVCRNQTAYLRHESEFKDKLSPIFISLNYSLSNSQEAMLHGQRAVVAQTRIILDCGEDNVCVPDLRLTAEAGTDRLLIGDDHPALLVITAENRGEGAYETELEIRPPANTHYQSMVTDRKGFSKLICAQKKENQTVVMVCELGNPMKQGQKLLAGLFFSVGNLEEVENHVSFTLQIKSKNSQNPDSNVAHLRIDVSAEAALEMRGGSSPPECVLPIAKWEQKEHPADLEEVGPLVEHVYELRNLGPSTVNARVQVEFPTHHHGDVLLYVFANASEDFLTCHTDSPDIDPYQLVKTGNATVGKVYKVKQNEVAQQEPQRKETVHVNCTSGDTCLRFVCEATGLERGWSAVVKVMSRLWVQTFLERPYENYVLHSTARFEVIDMPSKIQPEELPSGQAETQTSVVWRAPDGEKEVPVWWIVVAVVSGLFLLALLALIFWKVGFFNRNRPPCDDDDDAEHLAGAGQSEYAEMPTNTEDKQA